MLVNYTKARAAKLRRLKISDITNPIHTKIYWLNSLSAQAIPCGMHKHTFYEVHFILDGSISYKDEEGHCFHLTKGSGVLFSPHNSHGLIASDADLLRISLTFLPLDEGLKMETQSFAITETLLHCIDAILLEVDQKSIFSPLLIQNRIFEIICELMRIAGADKHMELFTDNVSGELIITKAKQYIADNKEKMLKCDDVAAHCHFNVQYLSRLFAKHMGITLLEYIHREKIKYAEQLLSNPELSLKQISLQLGFTNEYYFNTFFKRRNGISPGYFRQLLCK